jgi:MATE family multidrug resistance protein
MKAHQATSKNDGIMKELVSIAFPLMVSQACDTLMMFTDRMFAAKLGSAAMSAVMSGGLSAFTFTTFFVGLTGYANALAAQYLGAGRPRQCGLVGAQSIWIALGAYPVMLAAIPLGRLLFHATGVPKDEFGPQSTYFTLMMIGSIIGLLRGALGSFFSGIGRTRIVMIATVTCLVVNVGAVYVLMFGKLGLPALGVKGAAIGSIIAGSTGLVILAVEYFRKENRETFGTAFGFRFDLPIMSKLIKLGSPAGLELMLNVFAFNLIVLIFHSIGIDAAASVTCAFSWDMVSFIPLIGVNIAVGSLVGRSMGAASPDTAHRVAMSGIKLTSAYAALLAFAFSLFPHPLVGMFLAASDPAVPLAVYMVRLVSVYLLADALGLVFSGALRGAGDTFATMCISVGVHWLLLGTTFVTIRVMHTDPKTAWTILVAMIWLLCVGFYLRYKSGRWRSIRVVEQR